MTNCRDLPTEDLVAWLDGELPPDLAGKVERHVAGCAACAREADLLRRSGALLAGLPGMAPPQGFEGRVLAAARGEDDGGRGGGDGSVCADGDTATRGRLVRGAFRTRAAVAAAAVLVLAVGSWWLATPPTDPTRLSGRDEEAIARDLYVISHLDTLDLGADADAADDEELARIADDLDVIDTAADTLPAGDGG